MICVFGSVSAVNLGIEGKRVLIEKIMQTSIPFHFAQGAAKGKKEGRIRAPLKTGNRERKL